MQKVLLMEKSKKSFAVNALRRASYRHYGRYTALKNYKLGRNEYFCAHCGEVGGKKNYQLDHISPCVPVSGWDDFDGFIDRLLCEPSGYQLLCKECHLIKSQGEVEIRTDTKRKAKGPKKQKKARSVPNKA